MYASIRWCKEGSIADEMVVERADGFVSKVVVLIPYDRLFHGDRRKRSSRWGTRAGRKLRSGGHLGRNGGGIEGVDILSVEVLDGDANVVMIEVERWLIER